MSFSCPICTDSFDNVKNLSALNCGHVFHEDCLRSWITTAKTCPQCRKTCTTNSLTRLFFNASEDAAFKEEMTIKLNQITDELKEKEEEIKNNYEQLLHAEFRLIEERRRLHVEKCKNEILVKEKQSGEETIINLKKDIEKLETYRMKSEDHIKLSKSQLNNAYIYEKENIYLKVILDQYKLTMDVIRSENGKLSDKAETYHQIALVLQEQYEKFCNKLKRDSNDMIKYLDEKKTELCTITLI